VLDGTVPDTSLAAMPGAEPGRLDPARVTLAWSRRRHSDAHPDPGTVRFPRSRDLRRAPTAAGDRGVPDEQLLAVGGVDGSIRFWDLATRTKQETLRSRLHLRTGHGALTSALTFSRDGRLLASGHLDGRIYLWNAETGLEAEAALRHDDAVAGLAFSDDGTTLYSGGLDAVVKVWEVADLMAG
jgi:WD40 repeat protein